MPSANTAQWPYSLCSKVGKEVVPCQHLSRQVAFCWGRRTGSFSSSAPPCHDFSFLPFSFLLSFRIRSTPCPLSTSQDVPLGRQIEEYIGIQRFQLPNQLSQGRRRSWGPLWLPVIHFCSFTLFWVKTFSHPCTYVLPLTLPLLWMPWFNQSDIFLTRTYLHSWICDFFRSHPQPLTSLSTPVCVLAC